MQGCTNDFEKKKGSNFPFVTKNIIFVEDLCIKGPQILHKRDFYELNVPLPFIKLGAFSKSIGHLHNAPHPPNPISYMQPCI